MKNNWLQLFSRGLLKYGALNSINILGLSLGVTAAMMIALYVDHEYGYDNFHENANRIFRLEGKTNGEFWFDNLGTEHARELSTGSYPEVKEIVRFNYRSRAFVYHRNKKFAEDKVYQTSVGSSFFKLFDFKFLEGSKNSALGEPNSVVITKSMADKYFLNQMALGQVLNYDSTLFTVSAVIEDLPTNSHFEFTMLITNPELYENDHFHTKTYLLLTEKSNPALLAEKILSMDVAFSESHTLTEARLMNIQDIYLSSNTAFGSGGKGDILQIGIFSVLGSLILIIAIINYINLTFAIFLNKGKEVGIRKILGESRAGIIINLASQSVGTTLLSIPLIVICLYFFLPLFGQLMEVDLSTILFSNFIYILVGVLLLVTVGLLTIIYPVISLNQTDVSTMVKTKLLLTQTGGAQYRNFLILVQFIFLFTMGISAWFMNQQIQFLDTKDKGFNPENIIKIGNAFEIGTFEQYEIFKNELLAYPRISGVTFGPMMGDGMSPLSYKPEGTAEIFENLLSYGVDIDYFDVMNIQITEGNFRKILSSAEDGQVVSLVNESFVKRYDWADDPIGKKIVLRPETENELHRTVSGVFKDFHFFSFKEKITPQIISLTPKPQFVNTNILVKSQDGNIKEATKLIRQEWIKIQPNLPVEITLMDESIQKMYLKERQTGLAGMSLSLLAIVLSSIGIIGFMFYILGLKSKEIAIRKVLGASFSQVVVLLNRQLFYTILIAGIIGSISSYWLVDKWLQDYAYAVDISPITFIIIILLVYLGVFIIIGLQTLRKSVINPVVVLKED